VKEREREGALEGGGEEGTDEEDRNEDVGNLGKVPEGLSRLHLITRMQDELIH